MMKTVKGLLGWLTKNWEEISETFAWANVNKEMTDEEISRVQDYFLNKKDYRLVIIINGVNDLRPQRTWGSLPEWFRNNTEYHDIYHKENTFVFVSCLEDEDEAEKLLIESAQQIEKEANAKLYVMQRRTL